MLDLLTDQPLLTLFVVVAIGAAVGTIRLGPVRIGTAGALFVGLIISAMNPALANDLVLVQQLGLMLFVYTVGVASGPTLKSGLRQNLPLVGVSAVAALASAVLTGWLGSLLGLTPGLSAGLFAGALTAAPATDAAARITGGTDPSVGYSFGYPLGVIVAVIAVSVTAGLPWVGKRDIDSLVGRGLHAVTVKVRKTMNPRSLRSWVEQRIRLSYVLREGSMSVLIPGEDLRKDDRVVVVGEEGVVELAAEQIGDVVDDHLADYRSEVDFERLLVSNPELAGQTVGSLNLPAQFGALVTRVRRGDLDLLAREDLDLQIGDQVAVAVPRDRLDEVREFFGDSPRKVAEIDALALGVGLVLGLLLGMLSLPLPGGAMFRLGPAAGPLLAGMVLGAFRRTGPLIWTLPESVNMTIRQLGLQFFLAALGLGAGPKVAELLRKPEGLRAALLAVVIAIASMAVLFIGGRLAGLSAARTAGGMAGYLGQPAVLQAANARVQDERVESAYAALFASSIIVKILLVPLILLF